MSFDDPEDPLEESMFFAAKMRDENAALTARVAELKAENKRLKDLLSASEDEVQALKEASAYDDGDMVLVPREPTEKMIEKARNTLPGPIELCDADLEDIYITMIEAKEKP